MRWWLQTREGVWWVRLGNLFSREKVIVQWGARRVVSNTERQPE